MNNKRIISMLLIATIFFAMFSIDKVFAIEFTQWEKDHFTKNELDFFTDLNSMGIRYKSDYDKYYANLTTYERYNLVVYGPQHGTLRDGEYRYLGYTENNLDYTNTHFPADPGTDGSTPLQWSFLDIDSEYSWDNVNDFDLLKHMQTAKLSYDNTYYDKLFVGNVSRTVPKGGQIPDGNGLGTNVARLQSSASFKSMFSVYTRFINLKGAERYATLIGPALDPDATLECTVDTVDGNTIYYIRAGQESVTVPVKASATAKTTSPYVKPNHIKNIDVNFMGKNNLQSGVMTTSLPKPGQPIEVKYTRSELGAGTHPKTITATATMQTVFKDGYEASATKNITIIVENGPEPYATATIDAEDKKEFRGSDVPVNVTMTGKINNITDVSKIQKVEFTFRMMPQGPGDQQQTIALPAALDAAVAHTFYVPASKLNGVDSIDVFFEGRVLFLLKDGTSIEKRSIWGPPLSAPTVKDHTIIYKTKPPSNLPPVPIISAPDSVVVGDSFYISGGMSYDPDGTIEEYSWDMPGAIHPITENKVGGIISYPAVGRYHVYLGVRDNTNPGFVLSDKWIEVTPPYPIPAMTQTGALKVNRKITIDASPSYSHPWYPVDHSFTTWAITPVTAGITAADIKYNGSLTGVRKDFLVKKPGQYRVRLTVVNTAGMSSSTETIIDVVPDKAPIASFKVVEQQLRDPNNNNKAQIILVGQSYSEDGDYINKRTWRYAYDSDNDGLFTDETWKVLGSENNPKPELFVYDVGRYAFELEAEEAYGQPTIPEFIDLADLLKGNTITKPAAEKILEVINLAPVADISANKLKNIDIAVLTDYTGEKFTELQTKLNQYVADSFYRHLNVKLNLVNGSNYLGRYIPQNSGGFFLVQNETTPKYRVADWNGLTEYSDNTYTVTHVAERLYPSRIITTTNDTFPAYVRKSVRYNQSGPYGATPSGATLWLLENGDLYFMGTNSTNNSGAYGHESAFKHRPTKIMSNVKQLEGGDNLYFALTSSGVVRAFGHTLSIPMHPPYFTSYINPFNLTNAIPYVQDNYGTNPYYSYSYNTIAAGNVNGLNNIEYIWSSGTALVARDTSGKWYGLGRGLNAFGLSTGFENSPPAKVNEYPGGSTRSVVFPYNNVTHFDNVNTVREIPNLSALNNTLGGVEKVDPNKVYASNGDTYYIKETPTVIVGETALTITNSVFTYNKTGTWSRSDSPTYATSAHSVYMQGGSYIGWDADVLAKIQAEGVPISPYLEDLEIPVTGTKMAYSVYGTASSPPSGPPPTINPTVHVNVQNLPIKSGITDYHTFTYAVDYVSYSHKVYDPSLVFEYYDDERDRTRYNYGGWAYYYNYAVRPKVLTYERTSQAGRKAYGVKMEDLPSITFRPDAEKYILYLGQNDSFKKISKDIINFIVDNNLNVRVSANSAYVDDIVDTAKYINLRQFAAATPKGKIYCEYTIDTILQDITNENVETVIGGNKIYVIAGEDTVEYLKYYYDYENDIKQAERYKYDHDPYYFENSTGLASYSGQWLSALKYTFDKVGKLNLTYQAQDNPKNHLPFVNYWLWSNRMNQQEIYVHRRPIADFLAWGGLINATTKSLNITSYAYDLDHQSKANKGIVSTEMKWKYADNDTVWKDGYPTTITQGNPINIWQRVLDEEGAWSKPVMKQIEFEGVRNLPVAQFTIAKNPIILDELLKIRDTSYAREGTLARWHWIVVNADTGTTVQNAQFTSRNAGTGALAGYDANVRTNYSALGPGNYRVYLRVKDSNNLWSDEGTDAAYNLNYFYTQSFTVVNPPVARFTIAKNPIVEDELLKLRDTSFANESNLVRWHWVVRKLSNNTIIQNAQFTNSNAGTGELAGYDANVRTDYESLGPGSYKIYLRVKDSNNIWSDGGTDTEYDLNRFYNQTLVVNEGFKLLNFRVSIIRDLQLRDYYKNSILGTYPDKPIYVNGMGIDGANFGISSLTKGYMFEFEIDSLYFNGDADTIEIVPHFYTGDAISRDAAERDLYWEDSKHLIWKAGQGGHAAWNKIVLTKADRKATSPNAATWRGKYLIPGTAWAVPLGTLPANAKASNLKGDIIVSFQIKGYKGGILKYDYNIKQWPVERTQIKNPYLIGDVIRYNYLKSNLDDIKFKDNR